MLVVVEALLSYARLSVKKLCCEMLCMRLGSLCRGVCECV